MTAQTNTAHAVNTLGAQFFQIEKKGFDFSKGSYFEAMLHYLAAAGSAAQTLSAPPAEKEEAPAPKSGAPAPAPAATPAPAAAPAAPERAQWYFIERKQYDFSKAGFTAATNEYVTAMAKVMSQFMSNATEQQKTETNESSAYTKLASNIATEVAKQWELYNEEMSQSSGGLGFLGYIVAGITIVIGVLTEDPALVMMGIYSIVTQATHEDPIESACESLTGNKIAGEFLAGLVEACAGASLDAVADKIVQKVCDKAASEVAADAAAQGAQQVEKTAAQKIASIIKAIVANLGMTLMMSTFWEDVAAKIPGVGKDGAMWLGLLFAVSFAAGSGLLKENGPLKQIVEKAISNKFPDYGMTVLRGMILGLNLARNGAQMAEGIQMLKQADALEEAADVLRQLGITQSQFTLIQGLCDMFTQAMNQTSSMIKAANDDYTAFNQTLPSLARMMDINFQQAV